MSSPTQKKLLAAIAATTIMSWCTMTLVAGVIDCSTVIALTSSCSDFMMYGGVDPGLGSPCCNGLVSLYNIAADSLDNRRSACNCIMGLITTYNPNATTIARLPGLCGISLGFTIDPNTSCNSVLFIYEAYKLITNADGCFGCSIP